MIVRCCTVVLATNLAETSQAIENDVAYVIESGSAKEKACNPPSETADWQWVDFKTAGLLKGRKG